MRSKHRNTGTEDLGKTISNVRGKLVVSSSYGGTGTGQRLSPKVLRGGRSWGNTRREVKNNKRVKLRNEGRLRGFWGLGSGVGGLEVRGFGG